MPNIRIQTKYTLTGHNYVLKRIRILFLLIDIFIFIYVHLKH